MLGARPVTSKPVRWGFDASSRLVTLDTGRRVVVQRRATGPDGGGSARLTSAMRVLRSAGITVPTLVAAAIDGAHELLVFEYVDGVPGPDLVGDLRRGPVLADSMGRASRTLTAISVEDVPDDHPWSTTTALRERCRDWLEMLGDDAPRPETEQALQAITGDAWEVAVSHGDFVPANVLVAHDDSITLLDLGDVALRHSLVDLAWWLLVVRHHHPDLVARVGPRLLRASGSDPAARGVGALPGIALLRALQLAAHHPPGPRREHQLRLARAAVAWAADP